ncbi:HSP20-like chaperones superfamily protein [Melia azedarach]|uniref:HSP20-like chaperones superfamily protein n=1 Tax=Melia azedarach TaxID=155640 RepID=A0ACC1WPS9_MELAZ|nr:HSP20-like chaperones superfamily protein [Melia azedarach]
MSRHPAVKWAQRSDRVYITIDLPDAQDVKLKLEPEGKFFFSATSGADKIPYEVDFDLYDKVDVNESKASVGLRNICYLVKKGEKKWWSRLLKQGGKPPLFLKVDWDKWVDEDEEKEDKPGADTDFGDFDFSKMNMGGLDAEAAGDDDDDDSDTEDENAAETSAKGKEEAPSSNADEPNPKTA